MAIVIGILLASAAGAVLSGYVVIAVMFDMGLLDAVRFANNFPLEDRLSEVFAVPVMVCLLLGVLFCLLICVIGRRRKRLPEEAAA